MEKRYVSLDGLRGLAALAVALFHFDSSLMPGGYLAVDFFFVLSGFVLCRAYQHRPMSTGRFMLIRVIRLYPLYLVGAILGLVFVIQGAMRGTQNFEVAAAVLNLLMLPSPLTGDLFPLNEPAWSLFFELLANVAMMAFLIRLPALPFCLVAALMLWWTGSVSGGVAWTDLPDALARTAYSFTAGMVIAQYSPVRRPNWIALVLGLGLVLLLMRHGPRYDLLCALLLFPSIVYFGARYELPASIGAAFIGEVSYALYAVHMPIAHAFQALSRKLLVPTYAIAPAFLATALLVAWLAVTYIDYPMRAWLSKTFKRSIPIRSSSS